MNGYIRLHRSLLDWEWYRNANTRSVFIHLLLKACWEDEIYQGYEIKAGQVLTTIKELSSELDLTVRQTRTALNNMQKSNQIAIKTTNKNTLITIENWRYYQSDTEQNDKQNDKQTTNTTTNKRQTNDKPTFISKKQKSKKEKNNSACARVKHADGVSKFTPPDIQDVKAYCIERGNSVDPEAFIDFYKSKGWMVGKNKMEDWRAAVRNWERNEASKSANQETQKGRLDWIDDI